MPDDPTLFEPTLGALVITVRRNVRWGTWAVHVTTAYDEPRLRRWRDGEVYADLTRAEALDVATAVLETAADQFSE